MAKLFANWLKYWICVDFYLLDDFFSDPECEFLRKKERLRKPKRFWAHISRESHQTERSKVATSKSHDEANNKSEAKRKKRKNTEPDQSQDCAERISKKAKKTLIANNCKQNMLFFCSHELFEDNRKSSLPPLVVLSLFIFSFNLKPIIECLSK